MPHFLVSPAATLQKHCPKTCPCVVVLDTVLDTTIKKGSNHAQMDVHRSPTQDRQRTA